MNDEIYLTIEQYAAQEGVSRSTVRRWIKKGLIFSLKIRGRRLIPEDEPNPRTFGREESKSGGDGLESQGTNEECGDDTPVGVDVRPSTDFDRKDLRGVSAEYDDAVETAKRIPVQTLIYRRSEDCLYQVVVIGSDRT